MAETDRLRLLAEARQRQARATQTATPQGQVVATTGNGGRIVQMPDGTRSFTSPGYSTSDPTKIEELMQGATPVDVVQNDIDRERIATSPKLARVNEVARGIPFAGSYVDELHGAINLQRGENMRAMSGAMQRQHPGQTAALNVTGAVAGAIPMAMAAGPTMLAAAPSTLGGQALAGAAAGAAVGATEGAIYGYGEGQGEERAQNAKTGAMIGGAAGGVLGAAGPYAAAGIRNLIGSLKGSDVAVIASELGISRQAARVVRDTLERGTPEEAIAALQRSGESAMLADAGRPAMQLLDASAQAGGEAGRIANDAVQGRTNDATRRMTAALDRTLGAPQGQRELIDSIRTGSAPARSSAYDAAYAAPIDYASQGGRKLEMLMGRVPASAIRRADELMRLEGVESGQIMASIADNGSVSFTQLPDVRQLDYITRALNDVAENANAQGKLGGTTDLGRSTGNLSRQIRQTLRQVVPEYGSALDTAADAISQRNATDLGYNLLRPAMRREDVLRELQGVSQAERAAAQQGLRAYIDDTTANIARTVADPDTTTREGIRILRDLSSRANTTKLRALLGRDAADDLLAEMDEAATAFELRSAIAENSRTAIRQSIQGSVEQQTGQGVMRTLAAGEPVNATKRITQAITGETAEAQELRRLGIYEEIARALTEVRGSRAQTALRKIQLAQQGQAMTERDARLVATTLVSSGVLAGGRAANLLLSPQPRATGS